MRGLQILSPSVVRLALATKATMEAEVLGITDAGLLKRKTGCLHEVRRLEETL
jgi:hypothetical protein